MIGRFIALMSLSPLWKMFHYFHNCFYQGTYAWVLLDRDDKGPT